MALFILFWGALQFLTFRVNFAFAAMRKDAWNLFRRRSWRFLENDMFSP